MAQLPDGIHLIQQIDGEVVLFDSFMEEEILRVDPSDADAMARAQKTIYDSALSDEAKCFAHFWCGYFYAHATGISVDL